MAKKTSLKAALASQQHRLQKNAKVKEAAQRAQKQHVPGSSRTASTSSKGITGKRKSTIPFRPTDTILLIGEGNFSFARALLSHPTLRFLPPKNVTATAYDSEEICYSKYPDAQQIVADLRERGVEVIFTVDATALDRCKQLKGRRWDRVVWNFPHTGKGITDQDRNILANQMLLLRFLRSVASFLEMGPIPSVHIPKKRKRGVDVDDSEDEEPQSRKYNIVSEVEDSMEGSSGAISQTKNRGTVLITLRNVAPYTEWNLPKLAKSPPHPEGASSTRNPRYVQLRSFAFYRDDWPGYEHRMTKGERAQGTGTTGKGGEDRTWEFCLN